MVQSVDLLLGDLLWMAMSLLTFGAFLWCDELIKHRCCNIVFGPSKMTVSLPKSKTSQFREGSSAIVARSGTLTCPLAMLECYCARATIDHSSSIFLLQGIIQTKKGEQLKKSGYISYTRPRELTLQRLARLLLYDPKKFAMHSFRAGGAKAAANAGGQTASSSTKVQCRWYLKSRKRWVCQGLSRVLSQRLSQSSVVTKLAVFVTLYWDSLCLLEFGVERYEVCMCHVLCKQKCVLNGPTPSW